MPVKFHSKPAAKLRSFIRRFRSATAGVAAIEFAYLAPVLMILLLGTVEASRAISMNRKVSLVTSMTGDLVAREKDVDTSKLNSIMGVVSHVMSPFDASVLKLGIIPVMASPTDETQTFVYATPYAHNGKQVPAKCSPYTLPTGLVGKGGSVIIVESEYDFTPLVGNSVSGPVTWTDTATHSPRHACVDFENNNCVVSCP